MALSPLLQLVVDPSRARRSPALVRPRWSWALLGTLDLALTGPPLACHWPCPGAPRPQTCRSSPRAPSSTCAVLAAKSGRRRSLRRCHCWGSPTPCACTMHADVRVPSTASRKKCSSKKKKLWRNVVYKFLECWILHEKMLNPVCPNVESSYFFQKNVECNASNMRVDVRVPSTASRKKCSSKKKKLWRNVVYKFLECWILCEKMLNPVCPNVESSYFFRKMLNVVFPTCSPMCGCPLPRLGRNAHPRRRSCEEMLFTNFWNVESCVKKCWIQFVQMLNVDIFQKNVECSVSKCWF
jgi:hypothetical protein